ncbi:MAG: GNAT family N-acetyltransferase [Hyphomicrobiales bacterium]|nr:GNAT family N-acetyltransferase [Hyphomicrobiales bacterium]
MIEIRAALPDEIHKLSRIGLASWDRGIGPLVPADVRGRFAAQNPFAPFLQRLGPRVSVALVDAKLAGLAASEHDDDHISDVWVAPEYEGRGVGRVLIAALETAICKRGHDDAWINVLTENQRAIRLYRFLGYQTIRNGLRFDPDLEAEVDVTTLRKRLKAASGTVTLP